MSLPESRFALLVVLADLGQPRPRLSRSSREVIAAARARAIPPTRSVLRHRTGPHQAAQDREWASMRRLHSKVDVRCGTCFFALAPIFGPGLRMQQADRRPGQDLLPLGPQRVPLAMAARAGSEPATPACGNVEQPCRQRPDVRAMNIAERACTTAQFAQAQFLRRVVTACHHRHDPPVGRTAQHPTRGCTGGESRNHEQPGNASQQARQRRWP